MHLENLYEAGPAIKYPHWKKPSVSLLNFEFAQYTRNEEKWANRARIIQLPVPLFTSNGMFRHYVDNGEVMEIDRSFIPKVHGMSSVSTIAALKSLVSTYSKKPDVDTIVTGFKDGLRMPMPIILRGKKGYWILSGNTRCNVAFALGYTAKVIVINLPLKVNDE